MEDYSQRAKATMHMPDDRFELSRPLIPKWSPNLVDLQTNQASYIPEFIGKETQYYLNHVKEPNQTFTRIYTTPESTNQIQGGKHMEWINDSNAQRNYTILAWLPTLKQFN